MASLTYAPVPTSRNILNAFIRNGPKTKTLAGQWCAEGDWAFWFSMSSWSLAALALWRKRAKGQASVVVWLPDFFCNVSLAPLRKTGAKLVFYPVNDRMAPDFSNCSCWCSGKSPDILVVVHYFGFPSQLGKVREFCAASETWLVEDAAHVLQPIAGVGAYGDCVLYSPHKLLPSPDGAVLVIRSNGAQRLAARPRCLQILHDVSESLIYSSGFSYIPSWFWLLKRCLQGIGVRRRNQHIKPLMHDLSSDHSGILHPRMSPLSKRLLPELLGSLSVVAELRRKNAALWCQILKGSTKGFSSFSGETKELCPYLAPFTFQNDVFAEKEFHRWQHAGLPVSTWPDLPPEVTSNQHRHHVAMRLRKTRLYLSVHQSLSEMQIRKVAELL